MAVLLSIVSLIKQTLVFPVCAVLLWCRFGCVTIFVCPLTALGRQHVNYLQYRGVSAASLSLETSPHVRNAIFDCVSRRALAVLVVSPEQVAVNLELCRVLEACGVGLVVFDEAHNWLSWPAWRPLMTKAASLFPNTPRLALTATLQSVDEARLLQALAMPGSRVFRHPFFRSNLALRVEQRPPLFSWTGPSSLLRPVPAEHAFRLRRTFELCASAARRNGNATVYVHLRKDADDLVVGLLQLNDAMPATAAGATFLPYHAGRQDRSAVEAAFLARRRVIVVSTIAFGLGINSPAVPLVVHMVCFWAPDHFFSV